MGSRWVPLAVLCAFVLLASSSLWPKERGKLALASRSKSLLEPITTHYGGFDPKRATLSLVQVVFRHGARTPLNQIYSFPGVQWTHCSNHYEGAEVELYDENGAPEAPPILDMNTPELPGGCREGTLTEAGYGMAKDLGAWLRSRYVETLGFLPADWEPGTAALRTSPIRRTVATLRGVLTGLWPGLAASTQGQPLRVGASREPLELMYGSNNTCGALGPLYAAMERDLEAADARNPELPPLNRVVADALGLAKEPPLKWPKLFDVLAAMGADGGPMPEGAGREVLRIVADQAERQEATVIAPGPDLCNALGLGGAGDEDGGADRPARCSRVLRLGIGMLVHRLLGNMQQRGEALAAGAAIDGGAGSAAERALYVQRRLAAAEGEAREGADAGGDPQSPPPRLFLFSGHDSSVTPLLAVLGQPARAWPRFAASIVFELWTADATGGADGLGGDDGRGEGSGLGRRGLGQARRSAVAAGGMKGGQAGGREEEEGADGTGGLWVRILYDREPLLVPGFSSAGGWVPLRALQRLLLPYSVGPEEHTAECAAGPDGAGGGDPWVSEGAGGRGARRRAFAARRAAAVAQEGRGLGRLGGGHREMLTEP